MVCSHSSYFGAVIYSLLFATVRDHPAVFSMTSTKSTLITQKHVHAQKEKQETQGEPRHGKPN